MLKNTRVTAFTVYKLLKENHHLGGKIIPTRSGFKNTLKAFDDFKNKQKQCMK